MLDKFLDSITHNTFEANYFHSDHLSDEYGFINIVVDNCVYSVFMSYMSIQIEQKPLIKYIEKIINNDLYYQPFKVTSVTTSNLDIIKKIFLTIEDNGNCQIPSEWWDMIDEYE